MSYVISHSCDDKNCMFYDLGISILIQLVRFAGIFKDFFLDLYRFMMDGSDSVS